MLFHFELFVTQGRGTWKVLGMVHTPDQQTETWLQRAGIRNDKEAYMNLLQRLGVPLWIQAACFRTLARLGVRVHPRDAELVARFDRNRGVFETIRTMLCEDSHLTYVGYLKTRVAGEDRARTPENPGIPPERWDRYRQLMREVGVIAVSHVGDTITMRVSTCGSSSKGIVYSPAHRVVVSSLERYPLPPEQHAHLILDEPWHIYYGWES